MRWWCPLCGEPAASGAVRLHGAIALVDLCCTGGHISIVESLIEVGDIAETSEVA